MKYRIIIFISSFIVQIIVMNLLAGHNKPELYEYEEIANNLLTNHAFLCHRLGTSYYSLTPPLYPLLCALTYLLTNHSYLAMLLVQITLTSLVCVIVYLIGEEMFNKRIGAVGATLCIFHPGLVIYSTTKLHELSLVAFVFSLLILTILKFKKDLTYQKSLVIGFLIGVCILTRASIVFFMPLFLIWLCRKDVPKMRRKSFSMALFIFLMAGITILPWIIRNYYIHHKFVFIQTPSIDLWVGNNINATGSNYFKDGRTVLESMPEDFLHKIYAADELTQDRIFKEAVYEFIKAHPSKFVLLFLKKIYYFWWFSPQTGILYPYIYLIGYKVWYSIIFFFAIWGIIFTLSSRERVIKEKAYLLLIFFLAISVIQSFFYIEGRHRWAIEPLFLIFSANGFINITARIKQHLKLST